MKTKGNEFGGQCGLIEGFIGIGSHQTETTKTRTKKGITSRSIMTLRVCKLLWYAGDWFFTQNYVVCMGKMQS